MSLLIRTVSWLFPKQERTDDPDPKDCGHFNQADYDEDPDPELEDLDG